MPRRPPLHRSRALQCQLDSAIALGAAAPAPDHGESLCTDSVRHPIQSHTGVMQRRVGTWRTAVTGDGSYSSVRVRSIWCNQQKQRKHAPTTSGNTVVCAAWELLLCASYEIGGCDD
ncbi:unnamed protein product, partial [Ectocarpus sp. 6 AP-2014]